MILETPSRSLKEFRILPGFTHKDCAMKQVSLKTRLCRRGSEYIHLETPLLSAAMQAVTGVEMAIALAQLGGVGVLPVSQTIEEQCRKLHEIKRYKAGFQQGLVTLRSDQTLNDLMTIMEESGFKTFPVTDTGLFHGKLLGIITHKDFDPRSPGDTPIKDCMKTDIHSGVEITDLKEANRIMIEHGRGFLPIISREGTLQSVVFKKDLDKHIRHPLATVDSRKRLLAGAAISTHPEDRDRAVQLIEAGADFLVIDASDGYSCFQGETLDWLKQNYSIPVIAGNVVTAEAFQYLAEHGADAVKVGMGIGSGCITQEVKATGRGQATALIEIAHARDAFAEEKHYIPLIADGSMLSSSDMSVALALGADSLMMGNFFSGFSESNAPVIQGRNGETYKEYWMEGSRRAFNNRRYNQTKETFFEEGISGSVTHRGSLYEELPLFTWRLKSTFSTAGAANMEDFHRNTVLETISQGTQADSRVYGFADAT